MNNCYHILRHHILFTIIRILNVGRKILRVMFQRFDTNSGKSLNIVNDNSLPTMELPSIVLFEILKNKNKLK